MSVKLLTPMPGQSFETRSGARYVADQNGVVSNVAAGDVIDHLNAGCSFAHTGSHYISHAVAPTAATAANIVASVALANGSLTVAGQPDVPRKLQAVVTPGAAAVIAGSLTLSYTDSSGQSIIDSFIVATPASIALTLTTSRGVSHLASAALAQVSGGASPTIAIGTTSALGLPAVQGALAFSVFKEVRNGADETVGTVDPTGGTVVPSTAPNGTYTYSFGYNYLFG